MNLKLVLLPAGLAFALYLPRALRGLEANGDVVEYIDIARRLLDGQGYMLGVKAYHIGGEQVVHDGLDERAPLYPLLVAGLLAAGVSLTGLQVVNALLTAACVGLVCGIGSRLFGTRTGLLSGLLAAASPVVPEYRIQPMAEARAGPFFWRPGWSFTT